MQTILTELSTTGNHLLAAAIKAAKEENKEIDSAIEDGAQFSNLECNKGGHQSKFPMLRGSPYRSPGVAHKRGSSMCSDYYIKDRVTSDASESCNHALGVGSHRRMLEGGIMNGSSFFGSLLITKDQLLQEKYEDLAAHFNSGLNLSLIHMRDCPVAFTGTLQYNDVTPQQPKEEVKVDGVDGQRQAQEEAKGEAPP